MLCFPGKIIQLENRTEEHYLYIYIILSLIDSISLINIYVDIYSAEHELKKKIKIKSTLA